MRKYIHLGFCCLLSSTLLPAYSPSAIRSDAPSTESALSKDAKTGRILASVGQVIEGLIKLIQSIKDPNHKQTALLHVSRMLAGIFDTANTLPRHELDEQEVQELRELMRDVAQSVEPLLRQYLTEHAVSARNYLQAIPLKELDSMIRRSDANATVEEAKPVGEETEQELHDNVLNALHQLVQNLFAVIQHPDDHQVVGQSIADMLANIMNVASQTLKYEFLTSKDAEENVALYLESFSDELTKELKHLMLQTALHLRGGKCGCSSKSCCNTCSTNCCNNSCNSKCSSAVCKPCCKPCAPCCRNINVEDEPCPSPVAEESNADTRKGCCGCSTCGCSSGNSCGTCCSSCKTTCCKSESVEESVTRKSCSSCSSCSCKPKCSNKCDKCCQSCCSHKSPTVCDDEMNPNEMIDRKSCSSCCSSCGKDNCGCHKAEMSDDEMNSDESVIRKSCSSCSKCDCKPKCSNKCDTCCQSCCSHKSSEMRADNEPCPDEMGDRKGSCCSACGTDKCCCYKAEMSDDQMSPDEMGDRKSCSSCCSTCGKDNCGCHKSELTDESSPNKEPNRKACSSCFACKCSVKCSTQCSSCSQSCCRRRKPRRPKQRAEDTTKACGCGQQKPKSETAEKKNPTKTCCGSPVLTRPPKPHHKQKHDLQYPEQYMSREDARRIGSGQRKR